MGEEGCRIAEAVDQPCEPAGSVFRSWPALPLPRRSPERHPHARTRAMALCQAADIPDWFSSTRRGLGL